MRPGTGSRGGRPPFAFELRDLGAFPSWSAAGRGAVIGEAYEATLAALDRLEGHPWFYTRTRIALEDGTAVEADLLSPEQASGRRVILSGDWRTHRGSAKARGFDGFGGH